MSTIKSLWLVCGFTALISINSLFGQTVLPSPTDIPQAQAPSQATAQISTDPNLSTDETIIVTARRTLRAWRGELQTSRRQAVCRTTTTSGNAEIDQIACSSMVTCWIRFQPEFAAIKASRVPKAQKQQQYAPLNAQLSSCVAAENERGIQALAN
jgi:hypothetical protein